MCRERRRKKWRGEAYEEMKGKCVESASENGKRRQETINIVEVEMKR